MRSFVLAALAALVTGGPPGRAADPPPARKLHVLLAIDTGSDLRASVLLDQERMERVFKANIPADRLAFQTLTGSKLTSENVLAHYRGLKVGPDDALLFFYAGHGAKDPDKGNAFVPQLGKVPPVYRSDVREAMRKTGAGLVVLLTDCCSTHSKLAGKPVYGATRPVTPASATGIHPTIEHLFFRHRGVVDITAAADGEASWSDFKDGGVFTRTLGKQLLRPIAELDTDGDKFVSWKEFFPVLKKESEGTFRSWSARMRSAGADVDQSTQRPTSFSLGEPTGGAPPPDATVGVYAVICLVNESGEAVKYKYRWSARDEWQTTEMASGKRGEHSAPRAKGADLPRFEILFDGNKTVIELEADTWTGTGAPPRGAAGREYPILLRKKDK
ncbi:MAG: hypothetical protein JWO38_1048 [Gemmataceae bacterium]|nr:hypothetical protein [Gemmataceae bacterium]